MKYLSQQDLAEALLAVQEIKKLTHTAAEWQNTQFLFFVLE